MCVIIPQKNNMVNLSEAHKTMATSTIFVNHTVCNFQDCASNLVVAICDLSKSGLYCFIFLYTQNSNSPVSCSLSFHQKHFTISYHNKIQPLC